LSVTIGLEFIIDTANDVIQSFQTCSDGGKGKEKNVSLFIASVAIQKFES